MTVDIYIVDERSQDIAVLAAELIAAGNGLSRVTPPVVRMYGKILQAAVRSHAEGRPGPNKITGEYWNSIKYRPFKIARGQGAEVYSDAPQAFRLEYGFVGVDSLGRHYAQPPYPHFEPALREVDPLFTKAVDVAVAKALRRKR